MALPTNIAVDTTGHANIHNQTNEAVNELARDTGWRDISGLLINGWDAGTFIRIRRKDDRVQLLLRGVSGSSATSVKLMNMPAGFTAPTDLELAPYRCTDQSNTTLFIGSTIEGGIRLGTTGKQLAATVAQIAEWPCTAAWPSTLPGAAI